jgi:hypothetical protein
LFLESIYPTENGFVLVIIAWFDCIQVANGLLVKVKLYQNDERASVRSQKTAKGLNLNLGSLF